MNEQWNLVIKPRTGWFDIDVKNIWKYRDLIKLFVRRSFVSAYKQTILGPAWAIINPLCTTVIFTIIFGNIAGLAAEGVPSFIFFMAGNITWGYFANCLNATSGTFTGNAGIFGKVYFPRLVMPITTVISNLISFAIQYVFFLGFWVYFLITTDSIEPNWFILMTPILLVHMALMGLGIGIICSSLTTKYRDLTMLIGFGVQLWMYLTPVAYDYQIISDKWRTLYMCNPMTPVINTMRYAYLGIGEFELGYYLLSWAVTLVMLFFGVLLFSKVEKTFMDTV
jgi:lipopolysaccharide transport system permease protein